MEALGRWCIGEDEGGGGVRGAGGEWKRKMECRRGWGEGERVGGGEWVQVDGRCKGRWREWDVGERPACR